MWRASTAITSAGFFSINIGVLRSRDHVYNNLLFLLSTISKPPREPHISSKKQRGFCCQQNVRSLLSTITAILWLELPGSFSSRSFVYISLAGKTSLYKRMPLVCAISKFEISPPLSYIVIYARTLARSFEIRLDGSGEWERERKRKREKEKAEKLHNRFNETKGSVDKQ